MDAILFLLMHGEVQQLIVVLWATVVGRRSDKEPPRPSGGSAVLSREAENVLADRDPDWRPSMQGPDLLTDGPPREGR